MRGGAPALYGLVPSFIVGFTSVRVPAGGVHWDSLQHHLKWDNKHVTAITPCSLSLQRVRFILQGAQLPLLVAFEAECTSCHEGKDCLLFRTRRAIPHTTAMPQTQVGVRAVQCRGKRQANCSLTKRLQELCRLCKPISLSESVMIFNRGSQWKPDQEISLPVFYPVLLKYLQCSVQTLLSFQKSPQIRTLPCWLNPGYQSL